MASVVHLDGVSALITNSSLDWISCLCTCATPGVSPMTLVQAQGATNQGFSLTLIFLSLLLFHCLFKINANKCHQLRGHKAKIFCICSNKINYVKRNFFFIQLANCQVSKIVTTFWDGSFGENPNLFLSRQWFLGC